MTATPHTVAMPGQVWGLAAADPAGPLYVTSYAGRSPSTRNLNTTVLTAVDLAGATIWPRPPVPAAGRRGRHRVGGPPRWRHHSPLHPHRGW